MSGKQKQEYSIYAAVWDGLTFFADPVKEYRVWSEIPELFVAIMQIRISEAIIDYHIYQFCKKYPEPFPVIQLASDGGLLTSTDRGLYKQGLDGWGEWCPDEEDFSKPKPVQAKKQRGDSLSDLDTSWLRQHWSLSRGASGYTSKLD